MSWSDERPTEPGDYWLSLHPNKRGRGASKTAWPYQTTIEKGTGESADDFRYRTDQVTHWQPYVEPSRPKT